MIDRVSTLSGDWVTGFVDGEGCFFAYLKFRADRPRCCDFNVGLRIGLRADDVEILKKIRTFFGEGSLSLKDLRKYKSTKDTNASPQYELKISGVRACREVLIPHFRSYPLQSKKSRDFEIWSELVEFFATHLAGRKQWLRTVPTELGIALNMCEKLAAIRTYESV